MQRLLTTGSEFWYRRRTESALLMILFFWFLCTFLGGCSTKAIADLSVDENTIQTTAVTSMETTIAVTPTKFIPQSATATTTQRISLAPTVEPTAAPTAEPTAEPTEKPTPSPTRAPTRKPAPTATPKPTPTQGPLLPYYLYAEKGSFTLVAYGLDDQKKYTRIVRVMRMAIGRSTMTPSGKFKLSSIRERWHRFGSTAHTQYATRYYGSLYIHGHLYRSQNIHNLIEESYTSIGTKDTSGCLRLVTADAYWIYQHCSSGTILEIVSNSPKGFKPPVLPLITTPKEDPTDPLIVKPTPTSTPSPTPTVTPTLTISPTPTVTPTLTPTPTPTVTPTLTPTPTPTVTPTLTPPPTPTATPSPTPTVTPSPI